jgi:hypothetical protein
MVPVCGPEKLTLELDALAVTELNSSANPKTTELRIILRMFIPPNAYDVFSWVRRHFPNFEEAMYPVLQSLSIVLGYCYCNLIWLG